MYRGIKNYAAKAGSLFLGTKGRHYRKSLILLLVISSIPGLIVGGLIYWIAGGRIETELDKLHNNQIRQRAANIDEQFSYIELSLSHWAFEPQFDYELKNKDFARDFEDTRALSQTLLVMQGSNPLTKRAELYINGSQQVRLNPEYDLLDQKTAANYNKLLSQGNAIYWTSFAADANAPDQKDLTLVRKIPATSTSPFGAVLFRLDNSRINRLLKTLTPYDQGETFLMQANGSIIASAAGTTSFDHELVNAVKQKNTPQGSFIMDWNHITYTVSYGSFTRIDSNWTYVSAAPIDAITAPVMFISKLIWAISFAALLLAAILAWFASSRIYSPVDKLVQMLAGGKISNGEGYDDEFKLIKSQWDNLTSESRTLQSRLEEQLPQVREGFLMQLIQGYLYSHSEGYIGERMKHYGWTVDAQRFIVVNMQLTGFANLEGRFSSGDEGLVTFAAANIIGELAAARSFQCDVVNFHNLTMVLLVIVPDDFSYQSELKELCEEIILAVNQIVKMGITIAISRSDSSIHQIPALFEETKQAFSFRDFENQNQIIDMEQDAAAEENNEVQYPFTLEREIIQTLRSGQQMETKRFIAEFLQVLSAEGAKEIDVQQGMLQLLASIQHTILQSGINVNHLFKGSNMFAQLAEIREPKQMLEWFNDKVIALYITELEARSDSQVKKMIEKVMVFMQSNYMKDISLEICADMMGTNSYFLSKSFKQISGKNFIDYLTELRMDKAKELLRDTDRKIQEIAEQVGYQHSYFNRIFKKQEGITPSQYRESVNKKNVNIEPVN